MREIQYIEAVADGEPAVTKEEKARKGEYKSKQRAINMDKERELAEKKKNEVNARMARAFKKIGKTAMARSQKKKVKREKQKEVVDEETEDRNRYLGEQQPSQ